MRSNSLFGAFLAIFIIAAFSVIVLIWIMDHIL